jgi:hypothetical protein
LKVPQKPPKVVKRASRLRQAPGAFHEMFRWHLAQGTHPASTPVPKGFRWTPKAFASATRTESGSGGVSEQMVTAYRRGAHLPKDFRTIARPLFGDDPEHKLAQEELYTAWLDAEAVRQAGTTTRRREMIPSKLPDPPRRPDRPDRCFGRDTDIAELVTELLDAGSTALVLLGTGGIGKTTVASKVVHDAKIQTS